MKAAASAPHMAKLHEIVAKSAPYGDEDSWSSSECGRTWSPFGTVQKRHVRPPTTEETSQGSADEEQMILPPDNLHNETARRVARRCGIEHHLCPAEAFSQDSLGTEKREEPETLATENKPTEEDRSSQVSFENNYTFTNQPSRHLPPDHQVVSHQQGQTPQSLAPNKHRQPESESLLQADLQQLQIQDSEPEVVDDSTPSADTIDSSNPTTATGIATGTGITLSLAFRPNDQTAVCDGKLGVVRDFENEERQGEINNGIAETLSKCSWHKLSAPPTRADPATSGGAPVIRLTTPEGSEHELVDLAYYPGLDWADLNDEEGS